jgi:hypothetical protein
MPFIAAKGIFIQNRHYRKTFLRGHFWSSNLSASTFQIIRSENCHLFDVDLTFNRQHRLQEKKLDEEQPEMESKHKMFAKTS